MKTVSIRGVDSALTALEEEKPMDATEMFEGLEEFDHAQYEDEVKERWGDSDAYTESMRRTRRYGKGDWARIHRRPALHGVLREARPGAGGLRAGRDPGQRGAVETPAVSPGARGPADGARDAAPANVEPGDHSGNTRFRTTLMRVLLVQVVTLALLWFLQAAYHG